MQILAQDWQEWEMGDDARRKGATSVSMILSMPAGTDPERLKEAALDFAREEFANRSWVARSEEHTSELQSLMRISYDVFCLKKKKNNNNNTNISLQRPY